MSKAQTHEVQFGGDAGRGHAALGTADWLSLAATPTFAVMAVLTAIQSNGQPDIFCSALHGPWPLGGMVPMYVLMAAFHFSAWLRFISLRRKLVGRL